MNTSELERVESCEIDEHEGKHEDDSIIDEILEGYIPHEEPAGGLIDDQVTPSFVEILIEANIKPANGVATRGVVTGIVEETFENVCTVG